MQFIFSMLYDNKDVIRGSFTYVTVSTQSFRSNCYISYGPTRENDATAEVQ